MKKSMLAMMIWVILTLVDVHANDHGSTLNDPLEFHIAKIKFIDCLVYAFERCHEVSKEYIHPHGLATCAFPMFDYCMEKKKSPVNHQVVEVASKCMISCLNKRDEIFFCLEICFINCYEEHLK